jgi:raffinose/stachyose/melibiose transport system permease protein
VHISDPSKRTTAGGLGAFQEPYGDNIQLLCAGTIIIAPSLLVFVILQRSFVSALLAGAMQ